MTSASDAELIRGAVTVLHRRAGEEGGYRGLSPAAADGLCRTLTGIADDAPELDGVGRGEAVELARRLVDDDHPEHSPLWPETSSETGQASDT